MDVLILAAGFGTRLYPLTETLPKALIKVKENLLIDHLIGKIDEIEQVQNIYVLSNNKFFNHFSDWHEDKGHEKVKLLNNNVNHEGEKKGAIGDIQFFLDNVDTAELLILASDNVFDFKLKDLKEFSDEKNKSCVALVKIEDESLVKKYSCVLMNEDNKIHFFEEKPENPKSNLCGTPFYLLKEHDVKKVKENKFEKIDNMGNLIEFLHKKSEVYGKVFDDFWMDVGTKEELDKVNN